jgi:hypothetical protein
MLTPNEDAHDAGGIAGLIVAGGPGGSVRVPPGPPLTSTMVRAALYYVPAGGQSGYQLAGIPAWLSAGGECRGTRQVRGGLPWRPVAPGMAAATASGR